MSLIMKGTVIPQRKGSLRMLGSSPVNLMMENRMVWQVPKLRSTFNSPGVFIVPPGVDTITVCGTGAGGGGGPSLGGKAGNVLSSVNLTVAPGETFNVTVGAGGAPDMPGEDSTLGPLVLKGGQPDLHPGDGANKISCGGQHYDGLSVGGLYGGEAGLQGDGGNPSGDGGIGAGGGAGGSGGNGKIVISYFKGD